MHVLKKLAVVAAITMATVGAGATAAQAADHRPPNPPVGGPTVGETRGYIVTPGNAVTPGNTVTPRRTYTPSTIQGCPSGYVCVYPQNAGWNGGRPSHKYYYYGVYNLRNQFGSHRVFNNQTGGAVVNLYSGYNGRNSIARMGATRWNDINLTPVNSIRLI
jgi:hypothetical protein